MKKILLLLVCALVASGARAALGNDGYYRVNNLASGRYIYVEDNKGSLDMTGMTADMAAIELYKDADRRMSDPSTVIYVKHISGRAYDFQSQGTGVYALINYYVNLLENPAGSNNYLFYATADGVSKYLCDSEKSTSLDKGRLSDNGSGDWRKWQMTPISSSSSEYFGVSPEIKAGNTNYATFYASFPFSFASSGMEAYTISKVDNGMAVLKKVSGVIPASTPVLIKCAADKPSGNKLNLGGSASAISGNLLKGVYFNNSSRSHNNQTPYDSNTMRVLGTMADGSLGFVTSTEKYLAKNRAYLTVPSGSPAQIRIVTEDEYNNSFVTVSVKVADAAQGTAYVNTSGTTSLKVAKGTNLNLTATPKSPYVFSSWTLDGNQVSTSASCTVKAEKNATYTANFRLPEYAVTLSAANGLIEAVAGSSSVVSGQSYKHGTEITVRKVTGNDGYEFSTLKVGNTDVTADFKSKGSYTFTLTAATTITATFTAIPNYTVTMVSKNGKMTVVYGDKNVTSGNSYRRDTRMSLTSVVADDGYELAGLTFNSTDILSKFVKDGKYDFTLTENTTITATFTAIPNYTVTMVSENGKMTVVYGDKSVTSGNSYRRDTKMSLTSVVADDGYELVGLTFNSTDILSKFVKDGKYDFTLTENTTIKALFNKIPEYNIAIKAEHGTVIVERANGSEVIDGEKVRRDTELIIRALSVSEGWRIVGLTLDSAEILGAFNNSPDGYHFTVKDDVSIEVEYDEITPDPEPRLHTSVEGDGSMMVSLKRVANPRQAEPIENGSKIPYSADGTTIYIYLQPKSGRILGEFYINGLSFTSSVTDTYYGHIMPYVVFSDDVNISVRFVDDPSSVETVSENTGNAGREEYFDLNGVKIPVENLTPGIYIRRIGSDVTKVVIR